MPVTARSGVYNEELAELILLEHCACAAFAVSLLLNAENGLQKEFFYPRVFSIQQKDSVRVSSFPLGLTLLSEDLVPE